MYRHFAVADVSTSVLLDKDLILLEMEKENHKSLIHIVAGFEYGWFISIQDEQDEFDEMIQYSVQSGYSEKFVALMKSLRSYNFSYVRLDTEGLTNKIQDPPSSMLEHMEAERVRKAGVHE